MSSATRRRVLKAAAGVALGAPWWRPFAVRAQAPADAVQSLGDTLHVLTVGALNVVARSSPRGVLLVDGGPAASAGRLLERIAALPASGPIHTLFNTHWHPEQTGLNAHAGATGATIVAHENTRLWLTTDITYPWDGRRFEPLPEAAQPNETFYDGGELDSGERYGYLRHAAHTDGDLYVYFPDDDVLAVGDTVRADAWPFIDWWTGGWIGGMVGNLELLLHLSGADTRVVPARGPLMSRADLEAQHAMYDTIFARLASLLNGGMGPDEAVAARPAEEYEARMGPADAFVAQAFKSLWAYLSPDA